MLYQLCEKEVQVNYRDNVTRPPEDVGIKFFKSLFELLQILYSFLASSFKNRFLHLLIVCLILFPFDIISIQSHNTSECGLQQENDYLFVCSCGFPVICGLPTISANTAMSAVHCSPTILLLCYFILVLAVSILNVLGLAYCTL